MEALPLYGAISSDDRVVVDGYYISSGGVTSGIDGSLVLTALLRRNQAAKELQLYIVLATVSAQAHDITEQRLASARKYADRASRC